MYAWQKSLGGEALWGDLQRLILDAQKALAGLPKWEKPFHVFWLLGPFILLIERSPADVWLSILALAFAVRSLCLRDGAWLFSGWVRATFVFWFVCLLSAFLSSTPNYALAEAISWFRFPLFAMATAFWLGRDKRLLYAMIFSTGIGMMLMTGILTAEMLIEGQKHGRLTWPYGDLVPGNYLAKQACQPLRDGRTCCWRPRQISIRNERIGKQVWLLNPGGRAVNLLFALRWCLGASNWRVKWRRFFNHLNFFC